MSVTNTTSWWAAFPNNGSAGKSGTVTVSDGGFIACVFGNNGYGGGLATIRKDSASGEIIASSSLSGSTSGQILLTSNLTAGTYYIEYSATASGHAGYSTYNFIFYR